MEKEYTRIQVEDKALKSAAMYFGQELLPYLKVKGKVKRMLPTEQIRLEAVRSTEDTLFEMEDGELAHFEYESVEVTEEDLRRFRAYDAYTELHYQKPVTTYVICSGKVKRAKSRLSGGMNPYQVVLLQMKQRDADKVLVALRERRTLGERLTKEDLAPLLLTPLMSGESSIKERILEARDLIKSEQTDLNAVDERRMEAVLYAFACKFLEKRELDEVKEKLSMTVLGEMIWNDGLVEGEKRGREAGREAGIEEGRSRILIDLVCRKLRKGKTTEQIAADLDEDFENIQCICDAAKQCAPNYDNETVYRLLKAIPV